MPRKWKTAFLTILGYQSMPSKDVIESLKRVGYEGIEWTADGHFDPDVKSKSELQEIIDRTHDAGLGVSQIMFHQDLISVDETRRKARIERTVRVIEAAGECGAPAVSVLTGPSIWEDGHVRVGEDMSEGNAWAQAIEAMETFAEAAQDAGTVITTEAVYGMLAHDFYTHRYLLDKVNHPAHKVNFDPSHYVLYGIEDMKWAIHEMKDHIAHMHIKDGIGIPQLNKFVFPLLGEGRVNWKDYFEALDEIDYTGFCSMEFESFRYYRQVLKNDPEAAARILLEQMNALLED
ncbi:MAG: sugar phosphate isomerase/epimerase [Pirellulaceae bacterium]|nr:sugar phosphate isomerase/epimerase [Pirellulaceae bacterium]